MALDREKENCIVVAVIILGFIIWIIWSGITNGREIRQWQHHCASIGGTVLEVSEEMTLCLRNGMVIDNRRN